MPDGGDELPDYEEAGGEDAAEVEGDADAFDAGVVPVPFAWVGDGGEAGGGTAGDVEVGEAGEGEADEGAADDGDCGCEWEGLGGLLMGVDLTEDQVIPFLEAEEVEEFVGESHPCWGRFFGLLGT